MYLFPALIYNDVFSPALTWMTGDVIVLFLRNGYQEKDDYSDYPSLRVPVCHFDDSSVHHFITGALFSVTHLMLALVFSIACSNAKVAEPNPSWRLSSLNFMSWRKRKKKTKMLRKTELMHLFILI